jgi:hypothetical protein
LAWRCYHFRALPRAGGVLDQTAGLLEKMDAAMEAWNDWRSWMARQAGHEGEWVEKHPGAWETVQKIMELMENG